MSAEYFLAFFCGGGVNKGLVLDCNVFVMRGCFSDDGGGVNRGWLLTALPAMIVR